jgi:hypothetical protein
LLIETKAIGFASKLTERLIGKGILVVFHFFNPLFAHADIIFVEFVALGPGDEGAKGKTFAFGEADGSIDIDDASLHRIGILKHHKGAIIQLAFSPDGNELASTSWDHLGTNTITLFDVNTRQLIGPPLSGHKADISGVVFGDEGKTMFSADNDGVIFRWDVNVDSWQTLATSIAGRELTKDEAMEYLGEASPPPLSDPATLLKRADAAALKKAPDARALFGEAVKAAIISKDPQVSNDVCWFGSVDRFADVVLPAGDREVEVADEDLKAFYRDTRGLALDCTQCA